MFNDYPIINYKNKALTNILLRIGLLNSYKNASFLELYTVVDGETPESVAFKLYRDPKLSWIIMFLNDMQNREYSWPLDTNKFISYVENKYNYTDIFLLEDKINFVLSDAYKIVVNNKVFYVSKTDRTYNKITLASKVKQSEITKNTEIKIYNKNNELLKTTYPDRIVYEGAQSIHHFESNHKELNVRNYISGYINEGVNPEIEKLVVTNLNYENDLNEDRRNIYILKEDDLPAFLNVYKKVLTDELDASFLENE